MQTHTTFCLIDPACSYIIVCWDVNNCWLTWPCYDGSMPCCDYQCFPWFTLSRWVPLILDWEKSFFPAVTAGTRIICQQGNRFGWEIVCILTYRHFVMHPPYIDAQGTLRHRRPICWAFPLVFLGDRWQVCYYAYTLMSIAVAIPFTIRMSSCCFRAFGIDRFIWLIRNPLSTCFLCVLPIYLIIYYLFCVSPKLTKVIISCPIKWPQKCQNFCVLRHSLFLRIM